MCDGCGCDKSKAPTYMALSARQNTEGWHVHADGTAHRHDHPHGHFHQYVPVSRAASKSKLLKPDPVDSNNDGVSDISETHSLSNNASIK